MFSIRPLSRASVVTCASVLGLLLAVPTTGLSADAVPAIQPRQFAAVAHNSEDNQFLLFGGTYGQQRFSDTWIFGTSGWQLQQPATHPGERISAAAAYDSVLDEYVLFGGRGSNTGAGYCYTGAIAAGLVNEYFCKDTWTYKKGTWTLMTPAAIPPRRELHAMAFDAATKQVVLFGGIGYAKSTPLNDTWVWDGTTWKQVLTAHVPPARAGHSMAYDPVNQQVVLFGGNSGSKVLNDTWLWNGSDWLPAPPQTTPPEPRTGSAIDFDPATQKMVLFSGMTWDSLSVGTPSFDSWTWDGYQWQKLAASHFQLITDFTGLVPALAGKAIVANGTPTLLWLHR